MRLWASSRGSSAAEGGISPLAIFSSRKASSSVSERNSRPPKILVRLAMTFSIPAVSAATSSGDLRGAGTTAAGLTSGADAGFREEALGFGGGALGLAGALFFPLAGALAFPLAAGFGDGGLPG